MMQNVMDRVRQVEPVTRVGIILLIFALISAGYGYHHVHGEIDLLAIIGDFYANISAELGSIAITVIIIDRLNRHREERHEVAELKQRLVREVGSSVQDTAIHAIEELRARGWLVGENGLLHDVEIRNANLTNVILWEANLAGADLHRVILAEGDLRATNLEGSTLSKANLANANLWHANLLNVDLRMADLTGANLRGVNLTNASLGGAKLKGTNMTWANLTNARMRHSVLRGADLSEANLAGAEVSGAAFDETATLPDGSRWTPDTDMRRFTDPAHPDFWRSNKPDSPAYRGKE